MDPLPEDIKSAILCYIPDESVGRCKLVCKTWKKLLSHRLVQGLLFSIASFGQRNTQLYYTNYKELISYGDHHDEPYFFKTCTTKINHPPVCKKKHKDVMIGSCNGLVCFSVPHDVSDPIYICNPMSREYASLPRFSTTTDGYMVSGFGYLHTTNEYKVVRIYNPEDISMGLVQVYTLGSGSGWRNVGGITYSLWLPGVQANGALHFFDTNDKKIVVFDLEDEVFLLLPSPPCINKIKNTMYQVKVLRQDLYLVCQQIGERVDIWSFKQKDKKNRYDPHEKNFESWNWIREFTIPWQSKGVDGYYDPFALTDNGEVLLWLNETLLCCYDQKTDMFKKIVDMDKNRRLRTCQALLHVNSLVSLKDLGVRSKIRSPKVVKLAEGKGRRDAAKM